MMKIEGSGSGSASGSISQRHGSADPDPHQNVMDPEHCYLGHWESMYLQDKTRAYHEMSQGEHVHILQALQGHNHHAAQPQVPLLRPAK
jgi:hypothetical protein